MLPCFVLSFLIQLVAHAIRNTEQNRSSCYRRTFHSTGIETSALPCTKHRSHPKPEWVRREVLRIAALMPGGSCRKIADCFNRRFAKPRRMTVGKSYVAETIRKHKYEIALLRRKMKRRPPRPVPRNQVWGMDLTGKTDSHGKTHMLLGMVDHGTRAALFLQPLPNKSSWTLLGHLFIAIGNHGKPSAVRTDNEAVFCSKLFRMMLHLCGIRHHTIDLHCPWQNGRIERFFGTLKEKLRLLSVESFEALNGALAEFRFWYNHVRPHQNLKGATPAEAWAVINPYQDGFRKEYWFEAWEGLLQGYYLRR